MGAWEVNQLGLDPDGYDTEAYIDVERALSIVVATEAGHILGRREIDIIGY